LTLKPPNDGKGQTLWSRSPKFFAPFFLLLLPFLIHNSLAQTL
jgi:hypothetical protein